MASAHPRRPAFTGAPHQHHRAARRLGAGWRPSEVARLLDCDPATIHLLLREDAFVRLYRSYLALRQLDPAERLARLERLALMLLEEGIEEGDVRVAGYVVRERRRGRNPAQRLAEGIAAAAERDT